MNINFQIPLATTVLGTYLCCVSSSSQRVALRTDVHSRWTLFDLTVHGPSKIRIDMKSLFYVASFMTVMAHVSILECLRLGRIEVLRVERVFVRVHVEYVRILQLSMKF